MEREELHLRWALEEEALASGREAIAQKWAARRRKRRIARVATAAACIVVAMGAWMFGEHTTPVALPEPGVQLTLPDGTRVDATEAASGVESDGWRVALNTAGELEYSPSEPSAKPAHNVVDVAPGAQIALKLDDGTRVVVGSNSRLEFETPLDAGGSRNVRLEGEAWFDVEHNDRVSFRVVSQQFSLRVYGTEFNINARGSGSVEVVLVRGSVGFTGREGVAEQRLQPNERAVVERQTGSAQITVVDTYPLTAWKDGEIVFVDETLDRVMERLSEWYGLRVVFEDDAVRRRRFDINLPKYPRVSSLFYYMEKTTDLHFILDGDIVYIKQK